MTNNKHDATYAGGDPGADPAANWDKEYSSAGNIGHIGHFGQIGPDTFKKVRDMNLLEVTQHFMYRSGQIKTAGTDEGNVNVERLSWVLEEFKEYIEAIAAGDKVEQLDGGLDIIVTMWGLLIDQFGVFVVNRAAAEVARCNLDKVGPNMVLYPGTTKVGKPEGLVPPQIHSILLRNGFLTTDDMKDE